MIFKDILMQLELAAGPVAKAIAKGDNYKVIALAFKSGMLLKEHQTPVPAKLYVLEGCVEYREGEKTVVLNRYDENSIPVNITHSVFCREDALCLLIQS